MYDISCAAFIRVLKNGEIDGLIYVANLVLKEF